MRRQNGSIKIGCCGFRLPRADYMREFTTVEVQQTFYQPPQISTLKRWREEAPPAFEFTMKAWQLITHKARSPTYKRLKRTLSDAERESCGAFRATKMIKEAWDVTAACAEALKAKCILFQCPASFQPTKENISNMRGFFSQIERREHWQLCWEPRGDWSNDTVRSLCRELDLWHVVDPFQARTVTPKRCYFRLHGRNGWRYEYEDAELEELLTMLPQDYTSYVFFNNRRMNKDAARFQELVREI
jgi:uncharacterized protein YecE (DUF72 family)